MSLFDYYGYVMMQALCIFLAKFSGTVQETIDDITLTDVYIFYIFVYTYTCNDMRSVMLQ